LLKAHWFNVKFGFTRNAGLTIVAVLGKGTCALAAFAARAIAAAAANAAMRGRVTRFHITPVSKEGTCEELLVVNPKGMGSKKQANSLTRWAL
jgi:hypothetical protein